MSEEPLFQAAGALAKAYANVDWAATPLGSVPSWSRALRGAVDLALHTRFPVTLLWGPEFVLVYNEAYAAMIADKHPAAVGTPAREVFPEAWDVIGPMLRAVLDGEEATWAEDIRLPLKFRGILQERYYTFSYSPVRGEDGSIEGIVDIAADSTQQVVGRRRLQLLSRLGMELADLQSAEDLPGRALPLLQGAGEEFAAVDLRVPGVPDADRDRRLPDAPASTLGDGDGDGDDVRVEETAKGRVAWLRLSSTGTPSADPVLVVLLSEHLLLDPAYLDFLRLVAALLTRELDRARAREAERRAAALEREMSEALQRSLLTPPLEPDHVQIAVRYHPAAEQAQVGGDWYDAFLLPDGALAVVVGDVTGHNRQAAVAMAQVRNLLRGTSYAMQKTPARVLSALDRAMHGLAVDVFATAVLASIEQDEEDAVAGGGILRWSNAGHPPPLLLAADGSARLLETPPDLLLGLDPDARRADHTVPLEAGATLVFYTDGLIERRRTPLRDSLTRLCRLVEGQHRLSAEELCDYLLTQLDGGHDDDIALLVLRARHPEGRPRPAEAGPRVLTPDLGAETA